MAIQICTVAMLAKCRGKRVSFAERGTLLPQMTTLTLSKRCLPLLWKFPECA